ncbi:MAG: membrane-bound lytic murein transglycosylase MltF [Gammaproteobacteria bacterium]|nr:membrane-bound lytic murein transglycosylase MltF [Gammaproteobacteria bacterium]MBQ0838945.1 membrane-bound lytic murein transglycosylase MltF [Gammaproteobacteria bacterium]
MSFVLIRMKRSLYRLTLTAVIFGLCLTLSSSRTASTLESVLNKGVLRVISMIGPSIYFHDARGDNGFEYLLARQFAKQLNVQLDITVMDDLAAILNATGGPKGDFATASLTATKERRQFLRFTEPYTSVRQTLIYRLGKSRPKSLADVIGGHLVVLAGSSHIERLKALKNSEYPDLQWQTLVDGEMLSLMQMVHDGKADYAVVDSSAVELNRGLYPRARRAFDLSEDEPIAWAFPAHGDDSLLKAANRFLISYAASGELQRLEDRFFGHTDKFSVGGSQLFRHRIESRLANYEALFKTTAEQYQVDWQLLAAIAYQESHWNPRAKSPTGVRGLMMLTLTTAKEMGVANRLDPEQSLRGGTEYLLQIKKRIPTDIVEPDRTWLALAAYNIGFGHLEDARILTERHGKDPDRWQDIRNYLPLLQQKKYYSTLRYGFARGREPVQYVQNIRHFHSILRWHQIEKERMEQAQRQAMPDKLPASSTSSLAPTNLPLSL